MNPGSPNGELAEIQLAKKDGAGILEFPDYGGIL